MKQTIGEFLATQRKAKGLTQQEVADRLGISNRTLSAWETNKAYPDIFTLPALAEIYGVTTDEILKGERILSDGAQKLDELSERSQNNLLKSALARFETRRTLYTGLGICGIALFFIGFWTMVAVLWLGILLWVIGLITFAVTLVLLIMAKKNALSSAGIDCSSDGEQLTDARRRFASILSMRTNASFGVYGLILCAVGLFGLMIFSLVAI